MWQGVEIGLTTYECILILYSHHTGIMLFISRSLVITYQQYWFPTKRHVCTKKENWSYKPKAGIKVTICLQMGIDSDNKYGCNNSTVVMLDPGTYCVYRSWVRLKFCILRFQYDHILQAIWKVKLVSILELGWVIAAHCFMLSCNWT